VAIAKGSRRHVLVRLQAVGTDADPKVKRARSGSGDRSVPDRGRRQRPVGTGDDGDRTLLVRHGEVADAVIADPPETQAQAVPTMTHLGGLVPRDLLQ
jgi:hypothetical protein